MSLEPEGGKGSLDVKRVHTVTSTNNEKEQKCTFSPKVDVWYQHKVPISALPRCLCAGHLFHGHQLFPQIVPLSQAIGS